MTMQIKLEDIPQVAIVADQEYHDSILSTSFCHQSQVRIKFMIILLKYILSVFPLIKRN